MFVVHAPPTGRVAVPSPDALMCSLTLPGDPHVGSIARAAVRSALHAHGLDDLAPAGVQAVGELVACACLLAPGEALYLSLRYRDATLRLTTYDHAPRPAHPRLAAACDTHRDRALGLLAELVAACEGHWGHSPAPHPATPGTRTWAHLPRAGAARW
ncbi:ATP-binding protein [Streptomyces sp. NPDC060194]|uniref:ATP-binding protein n=1 Tax=Streptomyces sp. NPDC060194 TaxID=3347069 RepID=UPI00365420DF